MKRKIVLLFVALALCVSITGAIAFLSSKTEPKYNNFTIGEIKIELTEPQWDSLPDENKNKIPDVAENLSPSETIVKDPTITNTGSNDAFVYLKISVPKASVKNMDNNGEIIYPSENNPVELFSFDVNPNWAEFMTDDTNENYVEHYYHYKKAIMPNETTTPLFETVTFIDVIEGQIEEEKYQIQVAAYGAQAIKDDANSNVYSEWNALAKQEGLKICDIPYASAEIEVYKDNELITTIPTTFIANTSISLGDIVNLVKKEGYSITESDITGSAIQQCEADTEYYFRVDL